jgi:hypothetical protein
MWSLEDHLERWLREVPYTDRTKGDHRRAVQRLKEWPAGKVETLEAVTQKKAGEFAKSKADQVKLAMEDAAGQIVGYRLPVARKA